MKFKVIFLLFNLIILFSLLSVLFLPVFLQDWDFMRLFWTSNVPLAVLSAVLFLVFFALVNGYFLRYRRLYEYLENEDWEGVLSHLYFLLFERKKLRSSYIRIYIHTSVVQAQPQRIVELEQMLREQNASVRLRFSLELGLPSILANNHAGMQEYYGRLREEVSGKQQPWLLWLYAFSLFLQGQVNTAATHFEHLLKTQSDVVLLILVLYAYAPCIRRQQAAEYSAIQEKRRQIREKYSLNQLRARVERKSGNIVLLVLDRFVQDAVEWIYSEETAND